MNYPYNDENMIFDNVLGQYVITEQALLNKGVDIRGRISTNAAVSPENIIKGFLERASDMIYGYIHDFNADNPMQDKLIATVPSLRSVIQRAMTAQAVFMYYNGDLTLSEKKELREQAIDDIAQRQLKKDIPELGVSILYAGRW